VAAQAAVALLRPRTGLLEPLPVDARELFSAAQLERAEDYRAPQVALYATGLAVEAGLLVLLIRVGARRLPGRAPAAGAVVSVALAVVALPLAAVARQRGLDVGLVTRSWGGWAGDVTKSAAVGAVLAAGGAGLAAVFRARLGARWWIPGAGLAVLAGAALTFAGPVVLDPLFNRFERLPEGPLRADVLRLAQRAGVEVGEVYVMDASRRTTAANAYVTGLGASKRVVLYDTLVERFDPEQTRLVVAHELAHVEHRDLLRGLLFLLLVAPPGMWAVARLAEAWSGGDRRRWVPALALALGVVSTPVTLLSNQLSRAVEARADATALRLAGPGSAAPFEAFQRQIALTNVSDPDPSGWRHALFGTHPTTVQRVGIARAYAVTGER